MIPISQKLITSEMDQKDNKEDYQNLRSLSDNQLSQIPKTTATSASRMTAATSASRKTTATSASRMTTATSASRKTTATSASR
ncbi:hypothetical protein EB796_007577 [Bugula neritina]|uniref:Uncharacterized protein n=1 Tax=Bugula neritina TaxID=10212 RepID=A0A7J7K7F8_BUGNE|nr:hypothetical protein EB796_007577 [Bugula neritina]